MSIKERILTFIECKGIKKADFYNTIGMAASNFKGSGMNSDLAGEKIAKILSCYPDLSSDWLILGKGSMYRQENITINISDKSETNSIPVVDISLAAGYGCHNNTYLDIQDTIQLPSSMITPGATYFCARVKGQSMIPTLQDDSYLILRLLDRSEWQYMRDNYIYAVSDRDGMAYIKRIKNRFREHGFITLMSDNLDKANYPNFNLHEDEIQTILYAEWYLSAKMPNINDTYYKKLNDLENTVNDIKDMLLNERKGQ